MNPQSSFKFLLAVQDAEGFWTVDYALVAMIQILQPKFTMDDKTIIQLAKAQAISPEAVATILIVETIKQYQSETKGDKWVTQVETAQQFLTKQAIAAEKLKLIQQALYTFGLPVSA